MCASSCLAPSPEFPRMFLNNLATGVVLACVLSSCGLTSIHTPSEVISARELSPNWQELPYHVAVIPLLKSEVNGHGDPDSDEVKIDFVSELGTGGAADITKRVADALKGNVFSKVTVLSPPGDDMQLGSEFHDAYWAAAALEAGADLLMDFESLNYQASLKTKANPWSFPLYLAGPVELFFPDRKYSAQETTLAVTLFNTERLEVPGNVRSVRGLIDALGGGPEAPVGENLLSELGSFHLQNTPGKLRQFRLQPDSVDLHYADRLPEGSSGIWRFWKSMLIPSAFLERNTDRVGETLSERFALGMANDLARAIVEGDHEFILKPFTEATGYEYDPRGAQVSLSGDFLILNHFVQIDGSSGGLSTESKVIFNGENYAMQAFGSSQSPQSVAGPGIAALRLIPLPEMGPNAHKMEIHIPIAAGGSQTWEAGFGPKAHTDSLQLQLIDGARSERIQSWTHLLNEKDQMAAKSAVGKASKGVTNAVL